MDRLPSSAFVHVFAFFFEAEVPADKSATGAVPTTSAAAATSTGSSATAAPAAPGKRKHIWRFEFGHAPDADVLNALLPEC